MTWQIYLLLFFFKSLSVHNNTTVGCWVTPKRALENGVCPKLSLVLSHNTFFLIFQRRVDDQFILWLFGGSPGLVWTRQRLHQRQWRLQSQFPLHIWSKAGLHRMCGEFSFFPWTSFSHPQTFRWKQINIFSRILFNYQSTQLPLVSNAA